MLNQPRKTRNIGDQPIHFHNHALDVCPISIAASVVNEIISHERFCSAAILIAKNDSTPASNTTKTACTAVIDQLQP